MHVELDDKLVKRLEKFNKKNPMYVSINNFIEEIIEERMAVWPWDSPRNVCVHSEQCPYWKGSKKWKGKQI